MSVNRGSLKGKAVDGLAAKDQEWLDAEVKRLYRGKQLGGHMNNFFDCVKDRSLPISDVFTHHRTMTSCHLCNIAMLLKRKLRWDPTREQFVGDEEANTLRSKPQRKLCTIPT